MIDKALDLLLWISKKLPLLPDALVRQLRNRRRKEILRKLLSDEDYKWRNLTTLMRATGTSAEECRNLLIEVGARASLKKEGDEQWGLIERVGFGSKE